MKRGGSVRGDSAALVQCNLALPKFAGYIVDTVAHGGGEAELRSAVLAFVGVSIFGAGCTGCRGYLFTARADEGGRCRRRLLYTTNLCGWRPMAVERDGSAPRLGLRRAARGAAALRAANSKGPGGPTGPLGTPPRTPWTLSR